MQLSDLDFLLQGCYGVLGDWVYYYRNEKTSRRKRARSYNKTASPAQLPGRTAFKEGMAVTRERFKDPAVKALYQAKAKPGQTAFNAALSEWLLQNRQRQKNVSLRVSCNTCFFQGFIFPSISFTSALSSRSKKE